MSIIYIAPGAHITPFNPYAGEGPQDLYASYSLAGGDMLLRAGFQPGDFFRYEEGIFMLAWNRSGGALAKGDAVKLYLNDASRLATITSATNAVLTCSGASFDVPSSTSLGLKGKLVWIITGTGIGQVRRILDNTATTLTVARYYPSLQLAATSAPEAFDTTPVNTDTLAVVGFDEVTKTAAATDNVQGVALGAVADDELAVIQVAGPALVKCVGSTDALTALGPVVPSGTAGVLKGFTTAGETAAEARLACGVSISAYSGATALRLIHLTGNRVIGACAPKIR